MRYKRISYRYAMVVHPREPRVFGDVWRGVATRVVIAQPRWQPATDLYEIDGTIYVTIELAGVNPDELDIVLYQDAVIVEGDRRLPAVEPGGRYHAVEIRQGPFRIELPLPALVDLDQVTARYDRGLLFLELPKATTR